VADDVLRLERVTKSFNIGTPLEVEILHGIDLTLNEGEFCALVGPSGSGKSTLLNVIGLLDTPTTGKVFITGHDTTQLGDMDLTRLRGETIGFVFQYHHLIPAFTAVENVMMPVLLQRKWPDDEMRRRAEALLDQVGLLRWKDARVTSMSGGQQQRVAIARSLAMNPRLVLADEPTGNLDTKSADSVFELMREVNKASGTTFLMVTHNPELATRCDRIIEVVDGKISPGAVAQVAKAWSGPPPSGPAT